MESALGRVEAVRDGRITVVVDSPVACRRCAAGKGCGAGLLTGAERARRVDVCAPAGMRLAVGDTVTLSLSAGQLLRAATIAYGLPLLSLVAAAGAARLAGDGSSEKAAIVAAVIGLLAGIVTSRRILRRQRACEHFVPAIDSRTGH